MSDPFIERLFAGIPEAIEQLRPNVAEIEAFTERVAAEARVAAAATELVVARAMAKVEMDELRSRLADGTS